VTLPLGPVPPTDPNKSDIEREIARSEMATEHIAGDRAENAIELKEVEGLSQGRIVFRRFVRHKGAMISLAILVLVVILAFSSIGIDVGFGSFQLHTPGWWMWNYVQITDIVNHAEPTLSLVPEWLGGKGITLGLHPFGQDEIGHDAFARVMRGTQQSLMIIVVIGVVSTAVGVFIGSVAGYYRGRLDSILMRITDMFIIIPVILLTAIVGRTYQNLGSFVLALVLGLLIWTTLARLVRGEVLVLRELEFVDAARVAGASDARIIFRHILPNAVGVIIVSLTLTMASAILLETALSYLGFGVKFPDVSLGLLISDYQTAFNTRPWLFWWPGLFIIIIALTINFIGDGLRDAFDPRQRRKLNRQAAIAAAAARQLPKPDAEAGKA
jgi:ABC-type dipeptide/oligopeptide/nickel transport system permease subunit